MSGAGSFAASNADPYGLGEGVEPSQELDLGESAAAAGAGSSSGLARSHSGPATTKEAIGKRWIVFQRMLEMLHRDWETEEAQALAEKAKTRGSTPFTVRSGPPTVGRKFPSLMGAPPPSERAVPISGYAFREGTDPRLERAYKEVVLPNYPFIKDYVAKNFTPADFMTELMNEIAQVSKRGDIRAETNLMAIYGVLDQEERAIAGMEKADIAVYRAMVAQNALNALTARGFEGGAIYTLRAKRRNVRNKAQRRTRKGLVRQGSRTHRKARRGTGPRKSHRRRPKGL
jgi:hypothetical protein